MTETETIVKKQRAVNENTIIFLMAYNPKIPDVNAIIKRLQLYYFQKIPSLMQTKAQSIFAS